MKDEFITPTGTDGLTADVWFIGDPFNKNRLLDLLEFIANTERSWMPTRGGLGLKLIDKKLIGRLSPKELSESIIAAYEKNRGLANDRSDTLEGGAKFDCHFIGLNRPVSGCTLSSVSFNVPSKGIDPKNGTAAFQSVFDFLVEVTNPVYGYVSTYHEWDLKATAPQRDKAGEIRSWITPGFPPDAGLYSIYYLNYFGRPYVDFFGRDRFDAVERTSAEVTDHPSGGVCVKVGAKPENWKSESNLALSMEIQQTLNHNAFMDRNDPTRSLESPFRAASPHLAGASPSPFSALAPLQAEELSFIKEWCGVFTKGMKKTFRTKMRLDKESLERIDSIIDEGWSGRLPEHLDMTVQSFGSYLGEALVAVYGGKWGHDSIIGEKAVVLGDRFAVYPYVKMEKRFRNGKEDSISFLLKIVEREIEVQGTL